MNLIDLRYNKIEMSQMLNIVERKMTRLMREYNLYTKPKTDQMIGKSF